jgi:hypothetical protein
VGHRFVTNYVSYIHCNLIVQWHYMGLKNTKNQKTRIPNEVFRLVEAVNFGLWMYEMSSIQKHAPRLAVM